MLKLQFLLAWRNILKRRFYSSIEIIGLAIGIACFLIILLHIYKEFSFDRAFRQYHKIYRVLNLEKGTGYRYSGGASAIGYHARTEIPQVQQVVRVFFPYRQYSTSALVQHGDVRFYEENIMEADSNFFEVFNFNFIEGDAATALRHANSLVLSRQTAKKYFGDVSPLGKLMSIDNGLALQVVAVVDVPDNTHLKFDILRPAHRDPDQLYVWEHTLAFTYLKVPDAGNIEAVEKQLHNIVMKHASNENAEYLQNYFNQLQPLADVHTTVLQWDIHQATPKSQLWAIMAIAVFILMLAIVNFINLATARAAERMKETGISKILGASRTSLTLQFFAEFGMATLLAGVLALILLGSFIEVFNTVMNTTLSSTHLLDLNIICIFVLVLFFTSLLSGLYPAYRLSQFRAVHVIKRTFTGTGSQRLRQTLVVFQFVISIALLSGTFMIQDQVSLLLQADLGFNKDQVYIMRLRDASPARFERLKHALLNQPQVVTIAGASALLGGEPGSDTFHPDHMPEPTPETFAKNIAIDPAFLSLMDIPLLEGRNFRIDDPLDYRHAYIVNETVVKQFQLKDPVGSNFRRSGDTQGTVIGVMKDFHFAKMSEKISPMVFYLDSTRSYRYMFVRLQGDIQKGVRATQEAWATHVPEYPMEGFFQDDYFNALYKQEQQVALITRLFSMLAILLASLGLLGMSSFVIVQRRKEIGIRKVAGASVRDVLALLLQHFLKPMVIAFFISIPLTTYGMNLWLENFVVRIPIGAWGFVMAGLLTAAVAIIAVSYQTVKAAIANPVDALRHE